VDASQLVAPAAGDADCPARALAILLLEALATELLRRGGLGWKFSLRLDVGHWLGKLKGARPSNVGWPLLTVVSLVR